MPTSLWLPLLAALAFAQASDEVPRFGLYEASFEAAQDIDNPYTSCQATAELTSPDGVRARLPLFWDGGKTWKLRFSPPAVGAWQWKITSDDPGLNGKSGRFEAIKSDLPGGLRLMTGHPRHFERQNGDPFYFVGDTAWALFSTSEPEKLDRESVERYIDARASQGFNVVHAMLLSEAGQGNDGGDGFTDLLSERLNPSYWQEVDRRLAHANARGLTCGLVLAWADKGQNPNNWRDFPSQEARQRYARYVAARYGAFDVYFLVGGEWNLELQRSGLSRQELKNQYIEIGQALADAEPHYRLIGIHPGGDASVKEFQSAPWMSFADYQQIYRNLHAEALSAREHDRPVINSEYAYYLRDSNRDNLVDKPNSATIDSMRHATWDIALAGAYFITGFGTTYFGGNRDPGPFDVEAPKNDDWEAQVQHVGTLFRELSWWKLQPCDELLSADKPRSKDREDVVGILSKSRRVQAPPATTYWALAEPGKQYVVYVRGLESPVTLQTQAQLHHLEARLYNPRTGHFQDVELNVENGHLSFQPPDRQDWVLVVTTPNDK